MSDAPAVLAWVLDHVAVLLIPLMIWMVKTLLKVSQTIYGENGDNGLRGDVKKLREARHVQEGVLQRHEFQLEDHGRRLGNIEGIVK